MTQDQRNKKAEQLRLAAQIIETGCEWEIERVGMGWLDSGHIHNCQWGSPLDAIIRGFPVRIKPQPAWKLPDPPAGRKWHREDWTQEMLPAGWRPLLSGEKLCKGDQWSYIDKIWREAELIGHTPDQHPLMREAWRTRRPLPEPVIPVPEGWRELQDSEKDGRWIEGAKYLGYKLDWKHHEATKLGIGCYGLRTSRVIVPVTKPRKRVPLGPEDVVPGSVVRAIGDHRFRADLPGEWAMILNTDSDRGVSVVSASFGIIWLGWDNLKDAAQIKRPTDTEWQPCWKLEDEA